MQTFRPVKYECPGCAARMQLYPKGTFRAHGAPGQRCPAGGKTRAEAGRLRPDNYLRKFHIETRRLVRERERTAIDFSEETLGYLRELSRDKTLSNELLEADNDPT